MTKLIGKKKRNNFTLLELLIGISLLAIVGGVFFWNLRQMLVRKKFETDSERFQSLFVTTRSLALNSQMDFRLELKNSKEGWQGRLVCLEDFTKVYPIASFSPWEIRMDDTIVQNDLSIDFFSTGFVIPNGRFTFSHQGKTKTLNIGELFYTQEPGAVYPED